jgi:hypothetical protein
MRNAQKPDHKSLSSIIDWLKQGQFVIPDFQREFEWQPWDIRDLVRSIFLDYYIGSLLLWKGTEENFTALSCEPVHGFSGDERRDMIVLDGQQRLTALYYACVAPDVPLPKRKNRFLYFIRVDKFMAGDHDEAFGYDWTRGALARHADRDAQFENHWFPVSVVGESGWGLADWMRDYEAWWRSRADEAQSTGDEEGERVARRYQSDAREFGDTVRGITQDYQITYVELDKELPLDKVCDIFTQINSKGVRLDIFDLINALLKPQGLQLKLMYRNTRSKFEFMESSKANVYLLQIMSILLQSYCSPKYLYYLLPGAEKSVRNPDGSLRKEVLIESTDEFKALWDRAVTSLTNAIELLRHPHEYGVTSAAYLPYQAMLPAFSALNARASELEPGRRLDATRKIRHWYWASVFTGRYSGAVESRAARDFIDVTGWFDDDAAEPPPIADLKQQFRGIEFRKLQKKGDSIYNGVFNLLVIGGAKDWMTGTVPMPSRLDDHHIVPQSWGKAQAEVGSAVDTILNRTPLSSETNQHVIKDRLPNEYLLEWIGQSGEGQVRAILETHFISPAAFDILLRDPFSPSDFETFISERQKSIQDAIQSLLIKERLDLPPQLRDLDEGIESVELRLRSVISETLEDELGRLPPNISDDLDRRLQADARRNAALDVEAFSGVEARLQYSDFRELQDIITNRSLWDDFEHRFRNKASLMTKFDQVANLRNDIRHSRATSEVRRMEGEAAILWFREVLA